MNSRVRKTGGSKILIIGLGNILLADEGVGVHAARLLRREEAPRGCDVLEVGTSVLDALPDLERAEKIIIMDAMTAHGEPGTIYRAPLEFCEGNRCIASMHGFDIFRVMALAGRTDPPSGVVFGVEPHWIGWSMELSECVSKALPVLLESVKREAGKCTSHR